MQARHRAQQKTLRPHTGRKVSLPWYHPNSAAGDSRALPSFSAVNGGHRGSLLARSAHCRPRVGELAHRGHSVGRSRGGLSAGGPHVAVCRAPTYSSCINALLPKPSIAGPVKGAGNSTAYANSAPTGSRHPGTTSAPSRVSRSVRVALSVSERWTVAVRRRGLTTITIRVPASSQAATLSSTSV